MFEVELNSFQFHFQFSRPENGKFIQYSREEMEQARSHFVQSCIQHEFAVGNVYGIAESYLSLMRYQAFVWNGWTCRGEGCKKWRVLTYRPTGAQFDFGTQCYDTAEVIGYIFYNSNNAYLVHFDCVG